MLSMKFSKILYNQPGPVVGNCIPIYSEGWDLEIMVRGQPREKVNQIPSQS
jgi:hypothetical protein